MTDGESTRVRTVRDLIEALIRDNGVVLFMKGTRKAPRCGFSARVAGILGQVGVSFKDVDVMSVEGLPQALKDFSNWPTFPQLYVDGQLIGGCDIVSEMFQTGELQALLSSRKAEE